MYNCYEKQQKQQPFTLQENIVSKKIVFSQAQVYDFELEPLVSLSLFYKWHLLSTSGNM